jgi:hypothetical protein
MVLNPRRHVDLLQRHFVPTYDMLSRLVDHCPAELWDAPCGGYAFWHLVYHTAYWVDYWVRTDYSGAPWQSMTFDDKDVTFELDKPFTDILTQAELAAYLAAISAKVDRFFDELTDVDVLGPIVERSDLTYGDVLLMQVRHIQHHVGLCNAILREHDAEAVPWLADSEG